MITLLIAVLSIAGIFGLVVMWDKFLEVLEMAFGIVFVAINSAYDYVAEIVSN